MICNFFYRNSCRAIENFKYLRLFSVGMTRKITSIFCWRNILHSIVCELHSGLTKSEKCILISQSIRNRFTINICIYEQNSDFMMKFYFDSDFQSLENKFFILQRTYISTYEERFYSPFYSFSCIYSSHKSQCLQTLKRTKKNNREKD